MAVVVLAYGDEPLLEECLSSVLASVDASGQPLPLELVVVDNGSDDLPRRVPADPRVHVLAPGRNTGFAGGCNLGAEATSAGTLVFLNSDAVVAPTALDALELALDEPGAGLVCGSVLLYDRPERVNSVGNPLHFLGVSWSGGFEEPADEHRTPGPVTCASGALLATRRTTWESLGGFEPMYFAYHEDADLSLRTWLRGLSVSHCPDAVAWHAYEFSRNPDKLYLLERNRWILLATVFPGPVLAVVLPALVAFETAMLVRSLREGWFRAKLRGYRWLIAHHQWLRQRRARVQAAGCLPPRAFAALLTPRLEPTVLGEVPGLRLVNTAAAAYWRLARILLPRSGRAAFRPR